MIGIEHQFPGIHEAQELVDLKGEPPIIVMHWCEHCPKPGNPPEAGEFLSYSMKLVKIYAKSKLALGCDVWINNRQWFGEGE